MACILANRTQINFVLEQLEQARYKLDNGYAIQKVVRGIVKFGVNSRPNMSATRL